MNDKNREFHELIEKCWHPGDVWWDGTQYLCEKCKQPVDENATNSDYAADPSLVLREMRTRDGYDNFLRYLQQSHWLEIDEFLDDYILDTTGKLRDKAIEFMREVIWHR